MYLHNRMTMVHNKPCKSFTNSFQFCMSKDYVEVECSIVASAVLTKKVIVIKDKLLNDPRTYREVYISTSL